MKKLFSLIVLLALMVACSSVQAATTATMGDKNSSGVYRVVTDSNGLVTFASDTGIKFPYQAATTNGTVTAAMTGTTYVIGSGATSPVTLQLPAAVVGMEYTFVADDVQYIELNPNSTDIINYASLVAGSPIYNSSSAKGDSITLFCVVAGSWTVKSNVGTWVVGAE